ncbi:RAD55 family ATPase, partial [candidate division KSB1 bacterium]
MSNFSTRVTTGFNGLDEILDGLRIGDNVVWRVDDISDYQYFVKPFIANALKLRKKVVYFRFASHQPLIKPGNNVAIYELDAHRGFESFATRIHTIITEQGPGAFYAFDCLSNLLSAWATDEMIGQFFRVTCPYLFELDTVAYFALLRGSHSDKTIYRIRETTQVLLGVDNIAGDMIINPLKVWKRSSTTMFLPHIKKGDRFIPVADSSSATRWLTSIYGKDTDDARRQLDYWDLLFLQAEDLASNPSAVDQQQKMVDQLCRVM